MVLLVGIVGRRKDRVVKRGSWVFTGLHVVHLVSEEFWGLAGRTASLKMGKIATVGEVADDGRISCGSRSMSGRNNVAVFLEAESRIPDMYDEERVR